MIDNNKVTVNAASEMHFDNRKEAREYAIKLLEAGLTFLEIKKDTDC